MDKKEKLTNKTNLKKKEFFKNQKKNSNEILSGFIITCDTNREKNAINDAYNLLNEQVDIQYPNLKEKLEFSPSKKMKTEESSNKPILVSDLLEKELELLKEKDERIFYTHDIGIKKGVVFIKINPKYSEISPYRICEAIMSNVHLKKIEVSRFCHRIIPIEKAFTANFESFKFHIQEILKRFFISSEKSISWFLEFKSRNNSKYKQKEFLDFILENIGKNHFVSYKEPEITIFVEIDQNIMCISALPNFFTFKKYSLRSSSETIIKAVEKIDVKLKNIDEIAKNQEIKADLNEDNEEDVDDIRLL